ncbi:MAG: hypothetical protein QOJ92_2699 [Frankiales bacterium]|nr:hypothetical protein [Frankiales bacterium]
MRRLLVLFALLLTACTGGGASTTDSGPRPSPAPAFFDPCPAPTGSAIEGGLPDLELPCLGTGPAVKLSALRGPLVISVWASTCEPCVREVPLLQSFYEKAKGRVGVLGVDYEDSRDSAQDFAGHVGMTYPSVVDRDGDLRGHAPFVFPGLPFSVFVKADGTVASIHKIGAFRTAAELERTVREQLGVQL